MRTFFRMARCPGLFLTPEFASFSTLHGLALSAFVWLRQPAYLFIAFACVKVNARVFVCVPAEFTVTPPAASVCKVAVVLPLICI
jgi:hypothetical protein